MTNASKVCDIMYACKKGYENAYYIEYNYVYLFVHTSVVECVCVCEWVAYS